MHIKPYFLKVLLHTLLISVTSLLTPGFCHSAPQDTALSSDAQTVLNAISANSLRGHLSFIASDLLEGRNTPSPGLDLAAEYIAAQFRRAGLEPVGDDGYFQTANWSLAQHPMDGFGLKIGTLQKSIKVNSKQVSLALEFPPIQFSAEKDFDLTRAGVWKVVYDDTAALSALSPQLLKRKVVLTELPLFQEENRSEWRDLFLKQAVFFDKMSKLNVALVISLNRTTTEGIFDPGGLVNQEEPSEHSFTPDVQVIQIHDPQVVKLYDTLKPGRSLTTLSLHIPGLVKRAVKVRNVVGLLRGSDPVLKDTYVLVTAHYDHLGLGLGNKTDHIFNGANDDGSGTVSVIELASALAHLNVHPKRSIVFMTFFGEEKGLLGSRYYGKHPIFPVEKTVADVNLEQVGRTDSSEGPQVATASLTGFDYSDIGAIFQTAGEKVGVKVYKHERNNDAYFSRSDNQALANLGVPAHTLCVAYEYSDYHGVGDHWEKVDYENLEKINRLVALGLIMMANHPEPPRWNEANPRTRRYIDAWKKLHGK